jgi:hypothetical protein
MNYNLFWTFFSITIICTIALGILTDASMHESYTDEQTIISISRSSSYYVEIYCTPDNNIVNRISFSASEIEYFTSDQNYAMIKWEWILGEYHATEIELYLTPETFNKINSESVVQVSYDASLNNTKAIQVFKKAEEQGMI